MSKVLKEISCVVGRYTNAAGEQKNRYLKIGQIIDTKNGEMLKLDSMPFKEGGWDGWAYINDPRPREMKLDDKPLKGGGFDGMDDDF